MPRTKTASATLDDLLRFDGPAELIAGRIVPLLPSGEAPSRAAFEIAVSLRSHSRQSGVGSAYPVGIGYAIRPPLPSGRQSFSPDTSYHVGPRPNDPMKFIDGPPTFAVEVRSEGDYDSAAEAARVAKRADSFEAGTLVVWDVDPKARTVFVYRCDTPDQPTFYTQGQIAKAEPAVPG